MTIEEAIQILDPKTCSEALEKYSTDIETLEACIEAQNVVFDELRKRQWISVKDRLPQGSNGKSLCQMVIAYTVDKEMAVGWLNGQIWYLIPGKEDTICTFARDYVTHWQPLPEPPKEVQENALQNS